MTLVLTDADVARLLDREALLDAVEQVHGRLASGTAQSPAPPTMAENDSTYLPMVGLDAGPDALVVVKLLSDLPGNRDRGLPTQRSTIMVTSAETGECLALVDGRLVTAARTAAASAVATRHLARQGSSVLGLVGAGNLAVEHTRALLKVMRLETAIVWSRSEATLDRYRAEVADLPLSVKFAAEVEEVVRSSDVVCTLTPSRRPIVRGAWFGPGMHVNAVGAPPRPDHREVDGAGLARARVVVDSLATALAKSGEVVLALAEGAVQLADVSTELGDVIIGRAVGRSGVEDVTLFNSVGIGLQDLATVRLLLAAAREQGVGTTVRLGR